MAGDKPVYYTGKGVFNFDKKDYAFGEVLPVEVPEETIASMLAKGKASLKPPTISVAGVSNELGALRDKVQRLNSELEEAKEDLDDAKQGLVIIKEQRDTVQAEVTRLQSQLSTVQGQLTTVTGERDAALKTVSERDTTIEELTKQLMNPTPAIPPNPAAPLAPVESGAGPKGKQK